MKRKKVLITGAHGFLGQNLIEKLNDSYDIEIFKFGKENNLLELEEYTKNCDFVFHLAAIHRPKDPNEFIVINCDLTRTLLSFLSGNNNTCPVLLTSSIQASCEDGYGQSKMLSESILKNHYLENHSTVHICRLSNVFGKLARPNYLSVVATFCYNIARNFPIVISDPNHTVTFLYIDDVINLFVEKIFEENNRSLDFFDLEHSLKYKVSLKELSDKLYYFNSCVVNNKRVELQDDFSKKLYETFLSYMDPNQLKE